MPLTPSTNAQIFSDMGTFSFPMIDGETVVPVQVTDDTLEYMASRGAVLISLRSTGEPCIHSFPNDAPLELGEYTEHLEHRFARGRRGIKSLLVKKQTDTLFMKSLEDAQQVGERSTEPIHRPGSDHIELFRVDRLHHGVQPRSLVPALRATNAARAFPQLLNVVSSRASP